MSPWPSTGRRRWVARAVVGVLCALGLAAPSAAGAAVVGFDDLPAGTAVDDQYAALGVHFGPSPFASLSGKVTVVAKPSPARSCSSRSCRVPERAARLPARV